MDPRLEKLAHNLVNYSIAAKPGEKVWINYIGEATTDLARALVREVYSAGAIPFPHGENQRIHRELLMGCTKEQLDIMSEVDSIEMKKMDCFIGVRAADNASELADVPPEKLSLYNKLYSSPVHHGIRVPNTRWVVLRFPTDAMAQLSDQSFEEFEDFYYRVCNLDYAKMGKAMKSLVSLMEKTDRVRITAKDTDISFSIKGIPAIACDGHMNIPDGEVYTAPVRDSVNGVITYNTPSRYEGFTYENVSLTFKDGKIVKALANDSERANRIFDTDEGARYVGEFAIGVNPYVTKPMKEILFDEKICGSIHFTPGMSYDDAPNGNTSAIHWDLVLIQTPEYGGGSIWFDDVLIREDGRFVIPELECLNPENLM